MRAPPLNNKNGAASMTFKMALKIMEQYQRNQMQNQQDQWMMLKTFMEQQRQQNKIIMDVILSRNGRMNIDTTQLMHKLGEHTNVSETRADDRSTEAATEKPVPHQEWLDWVERAKQNEQKRQDEMNKNKTTGAHTEYINGAKYEWKPGNIALPQTANISSAFPASPNYFECLKDNDDPPTVEPISSRTDDS